FIAAIGSITWLRIVWMGAAVAILSIIGMAFEYPAFGVEQHAGGEGAEGLDPRKVGMWAFLGSECVFFASLISSYVVYKSRNLGGPGPEILEIPLTSFSTFVLLMSSLLMVLSL